MPQLLYAALWWAAWWKAAEMPTPMLMPPTSTPEIIIIRWCRWWLLSRAPRRWPVMRRCDVFTSPLANTSTTISGEAIAHVSLSKPTSNKHKIQYYAILNIIAGDRFITHEARWRARCDQWNNIRYFDDMGEGAAIEMMKRRHASACSRYRHFMSSKMIIDTCEIFCQGAHYNIRPIGTLQADKRRCLPAISLPISFILKRPELQIAHHEQHYLSPGNIYHQLLKNIASRHLDTSICSRCQNMAHGQHILAFSARWLFDKLLESKHINIERSEEFIEMQYIY